jgi:polyhydroxybutyrate depolymerase
MIRNFIVTVLILILLGGSVFIGITNFKSKEKEIEFDGRLRKYRVHVPRGYFEKDSYPLVVALHGLSQNARLMEIFTGLSRKADQSGFFVVYPYGSNEKKYAPLSWNAEFCCGYALEQDIDDVGFIGKVIDEVSEEYNIDPSRVYVAGFSNGAMLAQQIALKMPDQIAAGAVVSGAVGGMQEDDEEFEWLDQSGVAVPTIIFHGKEDTSIPFDGGNGSGKLYEFTGAYDTVNLWLYNNKCNTHPSEIVRADNYTKEIYSECESEAEVVFYALESGHVWPGGLREFFRGFSSKNISATDEIWEFFSAHSK